MIIFTSSDYEQIVKLSDEFNGADLRNVCTEAGKFRNCCIDSVCVCSVCVCVVCVYAHVRWMFLTPFSFVVSSS